MKNNILLLLPFLLCLIGCMKELSESVNDETVGLNGGFEICKNKLPVNWLMYTQKTAGSGNFSFKLDKKEVKEGNQSLRFDVHACSNAGGWKSPGFSREIPVKTGETYRFSAWVKNQNSTFIIRLSGVTAFEKKEGPLFQTSENFTNWQKVNLSYTIPDNIDRLRLEVNVLSPGVFWVDAIELKCIP